MSESSQISALSAAKSSAIITHPSLARFALAALLAGTFLARRGSR